MSVTGAECCTVPEEEAVTVTVYVPGGVPRFWKFFWPPAHPYKVIPPHRSSRPRTNLFVQRRLRKPNPERMSPVNGSNIAKSGERFGCGCEFCARNGSPAVVDTTRLDVAGFAPGVTVAGVKTNDVLPGRPLMVNVTGFVNALFSGVTVNTKFAVSPALMVMVVGLEANAKSGGSVTVVASDAESFAVLSSPPPETLTMLVTLAAVFAATLTVTTTGG